MTQLEKLYRKREKQKELYCKLRYAYPEIARECKRNVMLINKQIRMLKGVCNEKGYHAQVH